MGEYGAKVEKELSDICNEILKLLGGKDDPNSVISKASNAESKVFYHKMAGDYYRYIAEFTTEAKKEAAAKSAESCYGEAMEVASKDLPVTHPIRLGLALNFSVFQCVPAYGPTRRMSRARR